MNAGRLAGLLGLMAGAGALGRPEEAQAAAIPGFASKFAKAISTARDTGHHTNFYAGTLEPGTFKSAQKIAPSVTTNKVFISTHGPVTHWATGDNSIVDSIAHLQNMLDYDSARAVRNLPSPNPKLKRKGSGAIYNNDGEPFVAPFMPGKEGEVLLLSAFPANKAWQSFAEQYIRNVYPDALKTPLPLGRPRRPSMSGAQESPPARAQLRGFSAVKDRDAFGTSLGDLMAKGKKNLPALAGASGAALSHYGAEPEQAHAFPGVRAYRGRPDRPVEAPWLDPVDILTAPVGVPGAGAKAMAMAMAPAFSCGLERLGGLLGRLGAGDKRQN